MSEMLGTRVTFGGTIKRSAMDQLADMMEDNWGEWGGSTAYEELEAAANQARPSCAFTGQTNYHGQTKDIVGPLEAMGLSYRLEADGNYELLPDIVLFDPVRGRRSCPCTGTHEPVIALLALIKAQSDSKTLDALIAELTKFVATPPPLVIEEDAAEEDAALDKPKVVIEVSGGVAECTSQPPGVHVEIIDHDNAEPPINEIEADERAAAARDVGTERYLEAAKILGLTVVGQPEALMEEPK